MQSKDFLGRGLKFPLSVDKRTGKIAMVEHEDDIREAVGIVIRTSVGERVMRTKFGSRTNDYVFESGNSGVQYRVQEEIGDALMIHEPRIKDINVHVTMDDDVDGGLVINVSYVVRSNNHYFNMVYPFYLTEGIDV